MAIGTLHAAQRPCKLLLHIISFYQATYDLSTAGAATQQPSPTKQTKMMAAGQTAYGEHKAASRYYSW